MRFVDKWPSRMQGQWVFLSRARIFGQVQKILISFGGLPLPVSTSPEKLIEGG